MGLLSLFRPDFRDCNASLLKQHDARCRFYGSSPSTVGRQGCRDFGAWSPQVAGGRRVRMRSAPGLPPAAKRSGTAAPWVRAGLETDGRRSKVEVEVQFRGVFGRPSSAECGQTSSGPRHPVSAEADSPRPFRNQQIQTLAGVVLIGSVRRASSPSGELTRRRRQRGEQASRLPVAERSTDLPSSGFVVDGTLRSLTREHRLRPGRPSGGEEGV